MQIYKVGGAVRDRLLGRPVTDIDWVVVGASSDEMLARGYRPVGADFPVFLHPQSGEEYALARTERKSGRGYGGQADLEARLLRHVSPAFAEDPLRVLRVARFAARYAGLGFRVAAETLALMRQLAESGELQALTPERSWKEISRALMEPNPEVFIQVLHDCGALAELIPEVEALFGVPQPAAHHPEIDTGVHVLSVLQQCARHRQPLSVRWACLLHDLGKGLTSEADWPRHIAHEARGVPLIDAVNQRFRVPRDCQELARLVGEYHTHAHRALELRPNTLLELLQSFDVYRRPQRFEEFVAASEMGLKQRFGSQRLATPFEWRRPELLLDPRLAPEIAQRLAGDRMLQVRRQLGQGPEHESVLQHFGARQHQAIEIAHQVAVEQHVDIQRQSLALWRIAAIVGLDVLESQAQFGQRQIGAGRHHQVEERPALDTHRLALEYRRTTQVMKESGQRIEAGMQMALTLDIAAEAEVDRDQRHPRSISTPTPRAAGTAPGLVTRMRSQGMPRSPISTSARRSAKVSTNWKCDSRANSCTRSDNAA